MLANRVRTISFTGKKSMQGKGFERLERFFRNQQPPKKYIPKNLPLILYVGELDFLRIIPVLIRIIPNHGRGKLLLLLLRG